MVALIEIAAEPLVLELQSDWVGHGLPDVVDARDAVVDITHSLTLVPLACLSGGVSPLTVAHIPPRAFVGGRHLVPEIRLHVPDIYAEHSGPSYHIAR